MTDVRLGIVGAGSLGQTYAATLATSGTEVTLLATPRSAKALRDAGAIRVRGAVELEVPVSLVNLTTDPRKLPRGAGVIFTTKGRELLGAARQVRAGWPVGEDPDAWVAGIQNGVVKDDVLAEVFGADRVVGGVTIVGAQREEDGRVACTSRGATYFGELDGRLSARARAAVDTFNRAGLPTELATDIRSVIWSKMCNATGFFGVTCLTRIASNHFGHYPELVTAYMGLIRETAAVANAYGVEIGAYPAFPIRSYLDRTDAENVAWFAERAAPFDPTPGAPLSRTSMLQDLLAGRPLEVEAIFGDVCERAAKVSVPVPRLEIVRDLIRAIDPGRVPSPPGRGPG
jgi:2-dehydropantoate 2-reductase